MIASSGLSAGLLFILKTAVVLYVLHDRHRLMAGLQATFANDLFRRYLAAPFRYHAEAGAQREAHTVVARLRDYFVLQEEAVLAVHHVIVIGAITIVLAFSGWQAAFAAAAFVAGAVVILYRKTRGAMRRFGQQRDEASRRVQFALFRGLEAIREIKAHGREALFVADFADAQQALSHIRYRTETVAGAPRVIGETIFLLAIFVALGLVVGGGAGAPLHLVSILPQAGLYVYAGLRLMPMANRLLENAQRIQSAVSPVTALLDEIAVLDACSSAPDGLPGRLGLAESIRFEEVSYSYPGADVATLESVDLVIAAGEHVAIMGATGAGKTTLLHLLLGLLEPTHGRIRVDGTDLREHAGAWSASLGYVPQGAYIGDATLAENVAWGHSRGDVDRDRVRRVLDIAQLSEVLVRAPSGVDIAVGERGVRLSEGERQRLAVARALYHDPAVLVLDEATSALDEDTESALLAAILEASPRRTIVFVTHRRHVAARWCDRVVTLSRGRIVRDETAAGDRPAADVVSA